jgi:DNA end-binding protein Ku
VLMLQSLLWDDEVREAKFPALDEKVRVSEAELKMSEQLVDSFATDFSPEKFSDDYQLELRELIEAKLKKGDDVSTEETFGEHPEDEEDSGGEVLDLMEALRRSVDASRKSTGAQKKSAAKKPAAKPAAEKTAEKKPSAKRSA